MSSIANQDEMIEQEILKAAIRLYQKFGPNGFTMDDLANAAGRSRTSIYYYYKNRDEIYQAVLDKIARDMANDMRIAVGKAEGLRDKVYSFCHAKVKVSMEWKEVFKAMTTAMNVEEQSKHDRVMFGWHKKLVYDEAMILHEILEGARKRKEMRAITPAEQDMLAFLISSGIRGVRREIYELNDPHELEAALGMLTEMVVKWLKG